MKQTGMRALAALLAALGFTGTAQAADPYPVRAVRIVIGFGPGGLGDTTSRGIAQRMAESMGQSVVVENMPGAGGITAAQAVARAAPDGYTIGLSSAQNAVSPFLFKSLPFDPVDSFSMISTIGAFSYLIAVDKDSAMKNIPDLIAAGRKDPERFNLGTISAGSAQHLVAQLFTTNAQLKIQIVPFKTTGDLVGAIRGKTIEATLETTTGVIGQIRGGTIRALATTAPRRLGFLQEVPTVAESGVPGLTDFSAESWNALVGPAGMPREIVMRLNQEIAKALSNPALQTNFRSLGIEPKAGTPEELRALYKSEQAKWGPVIERAGIPKQ